MDTIIYVHARFGDLDLDTRSQWVGKGKTSALHDLGNKASNNYISIKLATTVGHVLYDLDFANAYMA